MFWQSWILTFMGLIRFKFSLVSENHGLKWILETAFCSNVLALLDIHDYVFTKICKCFIREGAVFGIVLKFPWQVNGNLCLRRKLKVSSLSIVKDPNEVHKCNEDFLESTFLRACFNQNKRNLSYFKTTNVPIYRSTYRTSFHKFRTSY